MARLGLVPRRRDGTDDLAGGHATCQAAEVAGLEGPVGPEGHFDRLFAGFGVTVDVVGR